MSAFKRDGRRCNEWGGREGWLATIEFLTDTASPVRLDVNKANNEQIESTAFVPTEEESISTTPHEDPRSDSASSLDHTDYHSTSLEAATSPLDTDDSPQSRPSDTPETVKSQQLKINLTGLYLKVTKTKLQNLSSPPMKLGRLRMRRERLSQHLKTEKGFVATFYIRGKNRFLRDSCS